MSTPFRVRAGGSVVEVVLTDDVAPAEADELRQQWADLAADDVPPVLRLVGSLGNQPDLSAGEAVFGGTVDDLADALSSRITLAAIETMRGRALMLHAAGVALPDGRVVGLVAQSGVGKTTAARELGRHFAYVTDETLVVMPDGRVIPYPKPLSIGRRPGIKRQRSVSSLGMKLSEGDLRLGALAILDRQPDVAQPRVEIVDLITAVGELTPQTSSLSMLPNPLRLLTSLIGTTGGVRRVIYSEASQLPDLIDDILAAVTDEQPEVVGVAPPGPADDGDDRAGSFRRAAYTDAAIIDGSLVVLTLDTVTVLEGLGPPLWLHADGSSADDLRSAALRDLPDPPKGLDVAALVSATLDELVGAGLLVRS